jgi:hypothetical protein
MYLTGIVILFVAGMVIQYVYFKEETKEEKDKKMHLEGEDIPLNKKE